MRHTLWIIALFAAQAHATFLQMDLETPEGATNDERWTFGAAPPGAISASFIIDTSQTVFTYGTVPDDVGSGSCFSFVRFGMSGRILDLSVGQTTIASGLSGGTGQFFGDRPSPCHSGDAQAFFAIFSLSFANGLAIQVVPDSFHEITVADVLAAEDPIAELLLAGIYRVGQVGLSQAGDGEGSASLGEVRFNLVPEPATLGLFALSLGIGAALRRKKR